jgi:predicted DNA-binding transcriptional regulator AlpA
MHARARVDMPAWPALLDEELGAAYLSVGRATFQGFVASQKIKPVDMGFQVVRWRRADIDRVIDSLTARGAKVTDQEPVNDASPVADPQSALERAARRARR